MQISVLLQNFILSFSVANLEKFVNNFVDGKLKPYIKSEPVPENNDGPVKVIFSIFFLFAVTANLLMQISLQGSSSYEDSLHKV